MPEGSPTTRRKTMLEELGRAFDDPYFARVLQGEPRHRMSDLGWIVTLAVIAGASWIPILCPALPPPRQYILQLEVCASHQGRDRGYQWVAPCGWCAGGNGSPM